MPRGRRLFGSLLLRGVSAGAAGGLEQDDFSSNRHPALYFCLSMIFFGKPVPTFPDHALVLLSQKVALQGWLESVKRRDSRWHWGLRWVVDDLERVNRDLRRMSRGL